MKVPISKAGGRLSRLGRLAWEGEEIVITRSGRPYLRLEPYRNEREQQESGGEEEPVQIVFSFDGPADLEERVREAEAAARKDPPAAKSPPRPPRGLFDPSSSRGGGASDGS